ncbi:MAG: hypothetical protein QOI12_1228 [Alphaproteobacteria bacterium]|jgi:hypothetical protein|nr:hypothetical protein [Alphaproteobacteria bacterium]
MGLFRQRDRFQELRHSPRHEVHYLAQVDPGAAGSSFNCIICDISDSGAKLTIGEHHSVPDEFTLLFRRRCRVVRRDDGQVGIQFVQG